MEEDRGREEGGGGKERRMNEEGVCAYIKVRLVQLSSLLVQLDPVICSCVCVCMSVRCVCLCV